MGEESKNELGALGVVAVAGGFDSKAEGGKRKGEKRNEKTLRDDVESEAAAREAATFRPLDRNLDEARQLLRLSGLEGRDPLQDAALGRLAIDRLDADADSDRDPTKAKWADQLRRELKERFNEIAPTSIFRRTASAKLLPELVKKGSKPYATSAFVTLPTAL